MNAPEKLNDQERGLYNKFNVTRTDGKDQPGGKHEGDEYFVLNLTTDKHAIPAIAAYADSCEAEYPVLASDLRAKIAATISKQSEFITVPETTLPCGTVVPSFKIMQYLAGKGVAGIPISSVDAAPWVNISYFDAMDVTEKAGYQRLTALKSLGLDWDIYQQDANWTGGKVGEGKLKQGLHKGTVNSAQPGTYVSPDPEEDRWLVLSNGARIHDWSGNAFQYLHDNLHGDERGLTGNIPADSPLLTTCPDKSMEKGTGWRPDCGANWSGLALLRGGYWFSKSDAGVFCLGRVPPCRRDDDIGFRCTLGL